MKSKKNRLVNPFQLLAIGGCIMSGTATILALIYGADFVASVIPFASIITPCINGLCTVIAFLLIFNPHWFALFYAMLFVQSLHLVFLGFDVIGLGLYIFLNFILFCKGFYKSFFKLKVFLCLAIWVLMIIHILSFSWDRVFIGFAATLFVTSTYVCIYYLPRDRLSYLLSNTPIDKMNSVYQLPEPGSSLCLQDLGLSERQCGCIEACLTGSVLYKVLADRYLTSESTIKKEMASMFKFFGVTDRESLMLLLSQYKIT
ncbi:MAG: hypothetical protein LBV43_14130 [Prevotella sp.]|jgi:hypothetical protein|nr:hypothetical protein [Prevotella sp.]